jgi:predicted MFS family arabinose efflux permease
VNKWLALINIPIQMGAIIFLFSYLGDWLDENYPHPKVYYSKILVLVGVALALYNVIRQVNEINKTE